MHEQRWQDLTEALPQLVWSAAPDGACDYFSTQWTEHTGVAESELLDARSTTWTEQKTENGYGELTGTVLRENGSAVPVRLLFVQENLKWKLYAIRRPFAVTTSAS